MKFSIFLNDGDSEKAYACVSKQTESGIKNLKVWLKTLEVDGGVMDGFSLRELSKICRLLEPLQKIVCQEVGT